MPDPTNLADLPPSWRSEASQAPVMPPAVAHAVARKVKNRRHALVLAMATVAEDKLREVGLPADVLEGFDLGWWRKLAAAAGHPSSKAPSQETRAAVIEKVRADLAEPYRAKGRG